MEKNSKTRKKKPKLERYFASISITDGYEENISWDTVPEDAISDAKKYQEQESPRGQIFTDVRLGKLAHRVLGKSTAEVVPPIVKEEIKKKKDTEKAYKYIQMRLDLVKITPQYVAQLDSYRLSSLRIRKAEEKDINSIVRIYNRSFMMGADPWSPASVEEFIKIFHFGKTVMLIASFQNTDVGFIIIDLEGEHDEFGVIAGLAIDPSYQRRGIGHFLGVAAWDYFRKFNLKELRCEVYANNKPSYRLIKGLSFEEYGEKSYVF
jgi:ribosomal protein S18 acetylase RimI-like enzyme